MLRLKHILSILFLVMATSVLAQETYVIDSVCVGAERTYRRNGEPGNTYDWYIIDTLAHDTFGVPGVDFTEIDGTDTTSGNEISYLWDTPGVFDILVYVTSEHGCDTLEQGSVKVFELPGVYASADQTICSMEDIVLTGDTAWNYSGMYWESTGDGAFSDTFALHPTYYLGAADSISGSVTLILTAYGLADNITCDPVVDSVTFFFSNPEIDLQVNDVLCFGDSSAYIKANISGGVAPYNYAWTGPDGFTAANDSISGLITGTYILTVTDDNGCITTDSTFINQPEEILLSIDSVHNLSCYQSNDGFILSSATGGTDTLIFNWVSYSGYTASGNEVYGLPADTFVVTVTDANGCEVKDTVILTEPEEFIAMIDTIIDVQCYESDNGAAYVAVTGGTAPFVYEWNNNPALDSAWVFNLTPGTHTVIVTDANLCMAYDTVEITEPLPLVLTADSIDVRCGGKKPGSIDLTVSGGTPFSAAPYYLFEWSDSTGNIFATTEDVDNLAGDQLYTVWVEDSLGCREMHQVYINEVKNILLEALVDSADCYGDLWSIDLTVSRGRKPFTYLWTDTAGVVIDTVEDLTGVPAGIYWVTVNDKDSCDESLQFIFEEPEELTADITVSDTATCESGVILAAGNPLGGTGDYTHQWTGSGVAFVNRTDTTELVFSGAPAGTYQLIYSVTDANNCVASDSVNLEVLPAVTAYDTMQVCEGEILADWNGNVISSIIDSVYRDTLVSQNGCDSIAILTVSILPSNGSDSTAVICEGDLIADWNGHLISSQVDSVYRDTLLNQFGCDSLISLTVSIVPSNGSDSIQTVCEGDILADWNGQIISSTVDSIYRDTLINQYGCDSIISLSVSVLPSTVSIDTMEICEGSSPIVWNNRTIISTVDSIYLDTLVNAAGCDSLLTMYVTILPVSDSLLDTVLCTGSPAYAWNGLTVVSDKDSVYQATLTNQFGCDSLVTLNVSILAPTFSIEDTTLCEGEPVFAWNSHTVLTDRDSVYLDTLVNAAGCDSLLTLNVFINPPTFSVEDTTLCEGEPVFVWNSHTVLTDRDSIYLDTLVNAAGCDSLLTLNVFINPPTYSTDSMEICEGTAPLAWNTQTILSVADSIYTDTLVNAAGCDSILTMKVTVLPPTFSSDTMEICEGSSPIAWNNRTIISTVDSVYLDTLVNAAGCDSLLSMYVTILPVSDSLLDTVLCTGSPAYAWNGLTVISDKDSVYQATLTNQFGCDSLVTLNVSILAPTFSIEDTTLCEGEPVFAWNSHTVLTDRDSVYLDTLVNAAGCDSLLTLNVFINPPTFSVEDTTLCEGEPVFVWNSHTVLTDRDSIYLDTLVNAAGCDSLLTLNVFINPPTYSTDSMEICEGTAPLAWNTQTILSVADSIYTDTLVNAAGCDSILTMKVTVLPPTFSSDTMEICEGSSPIAWNNRTIISTVDSVYLDTLVNAAGCDSLLTMYVTILPVSDSLLDTVLCTGSPAYAWNGLTVVSDKDSVYQATLTNQFGCDSLVTLNVSILAPTFSIEDTTLCEGEPVFAWNSHTVLTDRDSVYLDTLVNAAGCDSLLTLNVFINPPTFSVEDTTLCEGEPVFVWNSHTVLTDRDSIYLDTLVNAAGCDSLLTLNVFVKPPTFSVEDTTLCEGEPVFAWNSHTVLTDRDSIYLDTLVNAAGCDSLLTLNVTIMAPTFSRDTIEICEGSAPIAWNNRTIVSTVDSVYLDTLVNAAGCDSLLTRHVTILPITESFEDTILCAGAPEFVWNSHNILTSKDSVYLDTLTNAYGCDSLLTLTVTIIPPVTIDIDTSLCEGSPAFVWHSHTVNTTTEATYQETLTNAQGCDSVVNLSVRLIPQSFSVEDTTLCEGEPVFAWNSHTVLTDRDSVYLDTLVNAAGCDSLLTLNVFINPVSELIIDTVICEGEPAFAWNSHMVNSLTDSVYVDTLLNSFGCDSLVSMNVSVKPASFSADTMFICEGEPAFAWNSHLVNTVADSIYRDTLTNAAGCDSMLSLTVNILPKTFSIEDTLLCEGTTGFVWNGQVISGFVDATYRDTLVNQFGCDSTLTLNVQINPTFKDTIPLDVCYNDTVADWYGQSISSLTDSLYMTALTTSVGCDSLLFLDVRVLPVNDIVIDTVICEDEPVFVWNGNTIQTQTDSSYFATLSNVYGCDSSLTLNVTILRKTYSYTIDTIYDTETPYVWNDSSYFVGGIYEDTLTNAVSCDSILTLDLTIIGLAITDVYDTICAPDGPYEWNGDFLDVAGLYSDTLPRAAGGDSIVNLYLTIYEESYSILDTTICAVDAPFMWNSKPYSTDGTYIDTLTNAVGCDSILTLNLTIINSTLTEQFEAACESFTWTTGDGNTYTSSGVYDQIIGSGTCADTLRLHLIISRPIDLAADVVDVLCYGDSTGSIDLTINGGIAPYRILWNTGDTIEDRNNLAAGNYNVIVTDSLGCSDTLPVEISQPDSIIITLDRITDVLVTGDSTGSIEVSVSGGTPGLAFEWTDELGVVVGNTEDLFNQPAGDYTLTVTDANNCTAVETYTIIEPELTPCPEDLNLTCFEDLVNYPMPTTLEEYILLLTPEQEIDPGCGIDTASFNAEITIVSSSIYCYEEIRAYTLLDQCNGDTIFYCEQHVIVNDIVPPTISCPDVIMVTDGIVPDYYADTTEFIAAGGSFDDNCAVVSFRWVRDVSNGGTDPEVITRTYEVTDYCGNVATCTQQIEIYLTADFVIECAGLPPASYECKADLPRYRDVDDFRADGGYAFSYPYEIDSFWVADVSNGSTCPEIITRTYYIRNENGDIEYCSKQYTIDDKTPPVFTIPDKHISCSDPMPRRYYDYDDVRIYGRGSNGERAVLEDNCTDMSNAAVIYIRTKDPVGSCPTMIERVYRVRDACGNETPASEFIYIHDDTPPLVNSNFPTEITSNCDIPAPYTNVSAYIDEDCGPIDITFRDSLAGSNEPGVVYRIYRISDPCNYVEVVQKITIILTEVPQFDGLTPLCQNSTAPVLPTTSLNGITGYWIPDTISTDVAGTFMYMFYPDSGQCAAPFELPIEITPAVVLSENHVDQGFNPENIGEINLTVEQGTPPYSYLWNTGDTTPDLYGLFAGVYTVQVIDVIGCTNSLSVTITSDEPELTCPPDTVFECPDPTVYPAATNITELELLGGSYEPLSILADLRSFDLAGDRDSCLSIDRYYVFQDIYGRLDTCVQRIDFYDNIAPVLIAPDGDTAECLSTNIPDIETYADFLLQGGQAFDPNCSIDPSSFTVRDTTIIPEPGKTQVFYYYSIADFCGNLAFDTTTYLRTDDQAPEVFCADITVYLDEFGRYSLSIQDSTTLVDSVYDNCTAPEDMRVIVELNNLTCVDIESGARARVIVFDEAGLSAECEANVVVLDTVPPEAICQDIEVYLDANGEVSITAAQINNTSVDNCEIESIQISKDRFDCTDVGENIVQLIVTDAYGNSDTCEAVVNVIDEIPPTVSCIIRDTLRLSEEDGTFTLTWEMVTESVWDECGIDTVLLDQYLLDCDNIGLTTITATAYDVNGNASTCTAEFVVFGNIAPEALPDYDTTRMDMAVEIAVTENDYDIGLKTDIRNNTLEILTAPANGSVVIDTVNGSIRYQPNPGFVGDDVFRYKVCDDAIPCEEMCAWAYVYIAVLPANLPPVAVNDSFEVPCLLLTGNVALNDYEPDGDDFFVNPVPLTPPTNGILVLYDDGHFEYEPFVDFTSGIDSFQYEIWDEPNVGLSLSDTAWVYITRVPDNDCDGVADHIDIDDDNDGIRDNIENGGYWPEDVGAVLIDSDQDGIPDYLDIDSDNDGIVDNIEGQDEHNYIEPDGWRDDNNNGWDDRYDNDEGGYAFDLNLTDTDDDGIPDYLDSDSDNDNVLDFIEGNDDNADGIPDFIRFYSDLDRDGLDDAYDWVEGYGIPDLVDNETGSSAPLQDFDGDGWRDWRDVNDEDDEYLTTNEDINGDGDYSNDDLDLDGHPEYLDTEMECELFIPEGFSPNGDGVHDFFQILCIYPRYPDAKMMIFNRNGQLLWEKEKYGNYEFWGWNDAWWWGTTDNKFTIGRSGGLPAGNYIYVLLLNDGLGGVRNGTVMIAY